MHPLQSQGTARRKCFHPQLNEPTGSLYWYYCIKQKQIECLFRNISTSSTQRTCWLSSDVSFHYHTRYQRKWQSYKTEGIQQSCKSSNKTPWQHDARKKTSLLQETHNNQLMKCWILFFRFALYNDDKVGTNGWLLLLKRQIMTLHQLLPPGPSICKLLLSLLLKQWLGLCL
jgi:glycogen debranching enzyme